MALTLPPATGSPGAVCPGCVRDQGQRYLHLCALRVVGLALHSGSRELVLCPICALSNGFLLGECGLEPREGALSETHASEI